MKIAIVGVTGLVGQEILKILKQRSFPVDELIPVASSKSVGQSVAFNEQTYTIVSMEEAIKKRPDIALFSAGGSVSREYAPYFAAVGTTVIDNSSAWRMDDDKRLVVPEVNAHVLRTEDKIIANPNCSTIQLVMAIAPLHKRYGIKRLVISTYQSVTGTGKQAVEQMNFEREGKAVKNPAYPHPIDMNALPHIDVFFENGYTKEEMKLVNETRKILGDNKLQITATAVRIAAIGGHAESVNVEFEQEYDLNEVKSLISNTQGVVLQDNPSQNEYPMPILSHGLDDVFVGRLRRDESQANTLNMWIVADNLRKGAATNAVQIAEYLCVQELV